MHKSSIYLPEPTKQALRTRAAALGRSEAELIREAIDRLVSADAPASSDDHADVVVLHRPSVIGVGVGPGDPGLVTRHATATLRGVDRVLVATTDLRAVGRAEAVVRAVAPAAYVRRVPYGITPGATREASLDALADAVIEATDAVEAVAVAVLGDPAQWTVFPALVEHLRAHRPQLRIAATPGITAYQAAAAGGAMRLGEGTSTLVVTADPARAEHALAAGDAVALYKATTDGATVRALAAAAARPDAVVAEVHGLAGERRWPAATVPDGPLAYLASAIFPSPASVTDR